MQAVDETIQFEKLKFTFNKLDKGGSAYQTRDWFEEYKNPLYTDIQRWLKPKWVLDIGANYGLTVLFSRLRFPAARIIAAEPYGALVNYIRRNAELNSVSNLQIFEGFVGDAVATEAVFHVRENSSQDCRVKSPGDGWQPVKTAQTTLDDLARDIPDESPVYIKIDTQGYEASVFRGGERFLSRNQNWVIKTEFAPAWLHSQGTEPAELLRYLLSRYVVAEAPNRPIFGRGTLADAMRRPLQAGEVDAFLGHVEGLNRNRRGWVDLLLVPRSLYNRAVEPKPTGWRSLFRSSR